ncbi:MAG: cupin domain-containing protein [Oligoflexales bacterium]
MDPINERAIESFQMHSSTTGEPLSSYRDLAGQFGLQTLSFLRETLLPGRRASGPHYHTHREELVYVISGTPTLWLDGKTKDLRPGDVVGFQAGTKAHHMIVNSSDAPCELVSVASQPENDEVVYWEKSSQITNSNF